MPWQTLHIVSSKTILLYNMLSLSKRSFPFCKIPTLLQRQHGRFTPVTVLPEPDSLIMILPFPPQMGQCTIKGMMLGIVLSCFSVSCIIHGFEFWSMVRYKKRPLKGLFYSLELCSMVGPVGLEPTASCSQSRRASQLRHGPIICDVHNTLNNYICQVS